MPDPSPSEGRPQLPPVDPSSATLDHRAPLPPEASATMPPSGNTGQFAPVSPGSALVIGSMFGRYRIERLLGQGGMGAVYLACDTQLSRQVALKVPTFGDKDIALARERFQREAQAAANLHHPNICPVYDVGVVDGASYLTMAYVEGQPLSEFLKGGKRLEPRSAAMQVRIVALAMAEAHKKGIVHRDLKPSNLIINQKKQPVVMDFGLARKSSTAEQTKLTQSGALLGTPAYMSPEQVEGETDKIGPPSDIYSLGVILYELVTGRLPFQGSVGMLMAQIVVDEPPPPTKFKPDLHTTLEAIILKCLAKKPAARFASMREFADALEKYLRGEAIRLQTNPSKAVPPLHDTGKIEIVEIVGEDSDIDEQPVVTRRSSQTQERRSSNIINRKKKKKQSDVRKWVMAGVGGLAAVIVLGFTAMLFLGGGGGWTRFSGADAHIPTEAEAAKARETLKSKPGDSGANLAYGKFLGLHDGNWDEAVKYLAQGASRHWAGLAKDDLAAKDSHGWNRGEVWWSQAQKESGELKAKLAWRAAQWYDRGLSSMSGDNRARAEERLEQVCGAPNTATARLVATKDFRNKESGAPTFEAMDTKMGYSAEAWSMSRGDGRHEHSMARSEGGGVVVEAVGRVVGGASQAEWCILLRGEDKGGVTPSARVSVGPRGLVIQGPASQDGSVSEPIVVSSPRLKKCTDYNTIRVAAIGKYLEVYVNGIAICPPMQLRQAVVPGGIYLGITVEGGGNGTVEFRSFDAWHADSVPALSQRAAEAY